MGPHVGRKVLTVQTISALEDDDYGTGQLDKVGGFSSHGGVAVNKRERMELQRLCRTISRPALSAGTIGSDRSEQGQQSVLLEYAHCRQGFSCPHVGKSLQRIGERVFTYSRRWIQGAWALWKENRMYKPPTTIKQLHTNTLNQAIFISESAAVTYPQTV